LWSQRDDAQLHLWDDEICTFRLQTVAPETVTMRCVPLPHAAAVYPQVAQSLRLSPARHGEQKIPILVAGADAVQREIVRRELADTLPEGTCFDEAAAFWEVLARAPECRMVIFSGDLEDGTVESYMQSLAQRHPRLPLVNLKTQPLSAA